jgi:hypothetical protein
MQSVKIRIAIRIFCNSLYNIVNISNMLLVKINVNDLLKARD